MQERQVSTVLDIISALQVCGDIRKQRRLEAVQ